LFGFPSISRKIVALSGRGEFTLFLHEFRIQGYLGAGRKTNLSISDAARVNLFIGPNNTGKSIPFRFLHFLKEVVRTTELNDQFTYVMGLELIDKSSWWKWDNMLPISFGMRIGRDRLAKDFLYECPIPINIGDEVIIDGTVLCDDKNVWIRIRPMVLIGDELKPLLNRQGPQIQFVDKTGEIGQTFLTHQGQLVSCEKHDASFGAYSSYLPNLNWIMKEWADDARFFDSIRALNLNERKAGLDGGQELVSLLERMSSDLSELQKYERLRGAILDSLNWLLEPTGSPRIQSFEFRKHKGEPLVVLNINNDAIKLQNAGSGIAQLFILCAYLELDAINSKLIIDRSIIEKTQRVYFIEEPESHLHPALLRRFALYLENRKDTQFFVTSHSSALLNGLRSGAKVFSFWFSSASGCAARECKEISDQFDVLDQLGVKGSDLLQTNCVLWIEGPSDRIYLNWWLQSATDLTPPPIEGSDYAFAFYGGSSLSHFTLSDDATEDFIRMVDISRFSAVIMDRDQSVEASDKDILERKQRILASADQSRKLAILSRSREIENDLPDVLLKSAAERILGLQDNALSETKIDGSEPYEKQISAFLSIDKFKQKTIERKLTDKVKLARIAMEIASSKTMQVGAPEYISEIIELIRRSRQ
jgi:hypothetical protein